MKDRRAEIIVFSIFAIVTFLGGIFFAFSTPPTWVDLTVSFFYGLCSAATTLQVIDTCIEGQKADEEWDQFINGLEKEDIKVPNPIVPGNTWQTLSALESVVNLKPNQERYHDINTGKTVVRTLKKKRKKRKKNARRKAR